MVMQRRHQRRKCMNKIVVLKACEVRMKWTISRGKEYGKSRGVSTLVKPKDVQGKLRGGSSQPIVPDLTIGFSVL